MRFTVFVLLFLEMRITTFLRLDDEVFSSSESLQQSVYSCLNRLQITNYGDYYMRDNKNKEVAVALLPPRLQAAASARRAEMKSEFVARRFHSGCSSLLIGGQMSSFPVSCD